MFNRLLSAADAADLIAAHRKAPIRKLSCGEFRVGSHGSLSIRDGEKGLIWHDFEANIGGGYSKFRRLFAVDGDDGDGDSADQFGAAPYRRGRVVTNDAPAIDIESIWQAAIDISESAGHPAYHYLTVVRSIPSQAVEAALDLRAGWARQNPRASAGVDAPLHPVLIGAVRDLTGALVGLNVVFLTAAGEKIQGYAPKRTWGRGAQGGLIRISIGDLDDSDAVVVEGIENALSVAAAAPGRTVFAAANAGALEAAILSSAVRDLTLFPDRDAAPSNSKSEALGAGARAARTLAWRHRDRLDSLRVVADSDNADANDTLRTGGAEAVCARLDAAEPFALRGGDRARILASKPIAAAPEVVDPRITRAAELARAQLEMMAGVERWVAAVGVGDNDEWDAVIKAPAGFGKTTKILDFVLREQAREGSPLHRKNLVLAVPTHVLANELADKVREMDQGYDVTVMMGKLHVVGKDKGGEEIKLCKQSEVIDQLRGFGLAEKTVCDLTIKGETFKCPYYDQCKIDGYLSQQPGGNLTIVTHETLVSGGHPNLLDKDTVIIVDEQFSAWRMSEDLSIPLFHKNKHLQKVWPLLESAAEGRCLTREDFTRTAASRGQTPEELATELTQIAATIRSVKGMPRPDETPERFLRFFASLDPKIGKVADSLNYIATAFARGDKAFGVLVNQAKGSVEVDYAASIHERWASTPILNLDATDRKDLRHPRLRGAATTDIKISRNARFIQLSDRSLHQGGFDGDDGLRRIRKISDFVKRVSGGADALFVSHKEVVSDFKAALGDSVDYGHFNGMRGIDEFKRCEIALIVGRPQPSSESLDRLVRAVDASKAVGLSKESLVKVTMPIVAKDGSAATTEQWVGITELHDSMLRSIRDDEISQCIDRLRLIYNEQCKTVYLLTNVLIPELQPDSLVEWSVDVAQSDRLPALLRQRARAVDDGQPVVISFARADLAKERRENGSLWFESPAAAADVVSRSGWFQPRHEASGEGAQKLSQNLYSYYVGSATVSLSLRFRRSGQRGLASPALVILPRALAAPTVSGTLERWPQERLAALLTEQLGDLVASVDVVEVIFKRGRQPDSEDVPPVTVMDEEEMLDLAFDGAAPDPLSRAEIDDIVARADGNAARLKRLMDAAERRKIAEKAAEVAQILATDAANRKILAAWEASRARRQAFDASRSDPFDRASFSRAFRRLSKIEAAPVVDPVAAAREARTKDLVTEASQAGVTPVELITFKNSLKVLPEALERISNVTDTASWTDWCAAALATVSQISKRPTTNCRIVEIVRLIQESARTALLFLEEKEANSMTKSVTEIPVECLSTMTKAKRLYQDATINDR